MDWIAILSGFGVGAIVGMTGVGGGSLMTPLLIGVFKLHPAVAIGTDLWFAAMTKTGGAVAHHRHGHVDWRITALLLAGSMPAAAGDDRLMHFTGIDQGLGQHADLRSGHRAAADRRDRGLPAGLARASALRLERWLPEHTQGRC